MRGSTVMTVEERVEQHCRDAFGSWDGHRGLGGVVIQHFTDEQRDHWRSVFRPVVEGKR